MGNWDHKKDLMLRAKSHTALMVEKYADEIRHSIECTEDFPEDFQPTIVRRYEGTMKVMYERVTSSSALVLGDRAHEGRVCVLDFASYRNPGGKFIEGSSAQEEALCHDSFLYNVLSSERIRNLFYFPHKSTIHWGCYTNDMIYVPEVRFFDTIKPDVIVCAAPNKKAAMRYYKVDPAFADKCMRERCDAVLGVAAHKQVDTLILGAFGCGVFGNDPSVVAEAFKTLLAEKYHGCFGVVIFAVPDEKNGQYFERAFNS